MEQHLKFSIGTTFNGEGFDKLSRAAKGSAQHVAKIGNAAGDLIQQLGGVDRETNTLIKTGSRLIASFLSMGVWGAAIGAVTSLMGWLKSVTEQTKEATLAARGLSKEFTTLEAMTKGYQKRVEEWKNAAKEAAAEEKKAMVDKEAADKRELAAMQQRQKNLDRIAEVKEQIAALDDKAVASAERLAVANAERKLVYEQSFGSEGSQSVAQAELELAKAKLNKAIEKETEEREKAAQEVADQREKEKQKFMEMREAMDEEIRQREISMTEKRMLEAQKQAGANTEKVAIAQKNLEAAIESYKDNIAQNEVNRSIGISFDNAMNPGLTNFWGDLIKNRGLIQKEAGEVAVERGLANGSIRTVEQMRKARNEAARQANEVINSKETNQQIREDERAARIAKKLSSGQGKSLSKADQEFWEDRQKAIQARNKQANEIAQKEQELAAAKKAEEQSFKDIAEIRKKLDKLGLK